MGFRENLRAELDYSGIMIKELADLSGVNIHTINNYLNVRNRMPSAEAAVKIASVLGVTVEYLVTGKYAGLNSEDDHKLNAEIRFIAEESKKLSSKNRKIIVELIQALK